MTTSSRTQVFGLAALLFVSCLLLAACSAPTAVPADLPTDKPAAELPKTAPDTVGAETLPAQTESTSEFSCEDVGGQCMEGCEEGWVEHKGAIKPCFDSVCCEPDHPTCESLGGTCMEGCEEGYKPVKPTRGCFDSVCCIAE